MNHTNLSGKTAIVTGGASGIGAAVASRLAALGASVLIADVDQEEGTRTQKELNEKGFDVEFVPVDVSKEESVKSLVEYATSKWHSLEFLISNAGVLGPMNLLETSIEEWNRVLSVNLTATFLLTRELLPIMKEQGDGRIVVIASVNGKKPGGYLIPYRVSKAALLMYAQSLAILAAPHNITVNAVCPGVTITQMQRQVIEQKLSESDRTVEEYLHERAQSVPSKKLAETENIADAVEFFLSDQSLHCTGQKLFVDGGEFQEL